MNIFIIILELIGTVAFSASGAMVGIKKHMDIFGVMILGLVTAVGGGVIRDLTLGITPPAAFRDPIYAAAVFEFHSCHRVSSAGSAPAGAASADL